MFDNTATSIMVGLVIKLLATGIILVYIVPRQYLETLRPRDGLTRLRWFLLLLLVFSAVMSIPGTTYQIYRLLGTDSEALRNLATVSGNISILGNTILIYSIFTYKWRSK